MSLAVGDCVGIAREPWWKEQFSIVLETLKKIIQITDIVYLSLFVSLIGHLMPIKDYMHYHIAV